MENEVWKDVSGYEGMYEVSNLGRVKSLKQGKERILKPKTEKCGHLHVGLYKNGEQKKYYVHRLVAQVFLSNPQNLPMINHKDDNPSNNQVENLEFCTAKYNSNYGTRTQRQAEKLSKPVIQFTKDGEFVREWKSATDVQRNLGYNNGHISECCNRKRKSAYSFIWKYKN